MFKKKPKQAKGPQGKGKKNAKKGGANSSATSADPRGTNNAQPSKVVLSRENFNIHPGFVQALLTDANFSVAVIGDSETGKSSLINRIAGNAWAPEVRNVESCQLQWISAAFPGHTAVADVREVKHTMRFQTGAKTPKAHIVAFRETLLNSDAVIAVYDPTRRTSFEYLQTAISLMRGDTASNQAQAPSPTSEAKTPLRAVPPILLVSNFKDEEASKQQSVSRVLLAETQEYADALARHAVTKIQAFVTEASCVNCFGLERCAEFLDIPMLRAEVGVCNSA